MAIESIGESRSVKESAFWLNTILFKLWRVEGGGLEPRLSSSVSAMIAESLNRPFSKPSVIAHVALDGFTFGSSPPIVSRVEMKGVDDDRWVVSMDVDVGMLLHDAVLLLGKCHSRDRLDVIYSFNLILSSCLSFTRYKAFFPRISVSTLDENVDQFIRCAGHPQCIY